MTIVSELEQAWSLQSEWHGLLKNSQTNLVFQTPEFLLSWWQTEGLATNPQAKLEIVLINNESNQLIGLAPFFKTSSNQLKLLGCVDLSDYLDILVHKDYSYTVYQQLSNWLLSQSITQLSLCSLPSSSPSLDWAKSLNSSFQVTIQQQEVCPVISLPGSWEDYLQNLKKKQRHEVKRKWRKLENETELSFQVVTSPADLKPKINDFIQLHKESSQEKKAFWTAARELFFHEFIQAAADNNWLALYFALVDNKPVATMLIFEYQNSFYLYNSGFDPEYSKLSVGQVLTSYTIKDAVDKGIARYDFLRGDEEYKFRLGGVAEPIFDATISLV